MPLYQLIYEEEDTPAPLRVSGGDHRNVWGNTPCEQFQLRRLRLCLKQMKDEKRKILLALASRIAQRTRSGK